jgi:hypothetical protein
MVHAGKSSYHKSIYKLGYYSMYSDYVIEWTSKKLWFDFWQGQNMQTGSGAHPASFSVGTEESFPRMKLLEHEADHSPPSSGAILLPMLHHVPLRQAQEKPFNFTFM